MTDKPIIPPEEMARKFAEQRRIEEESKERRRKYIRFDWSGLPRTPMADKQHPKDFEGLRVLMADGRKISLQSMCQNYIYAGHMLGATHHPEQTVLKTIERMEEMDRWIKAPPVVLPPVLLEFDAPRTPIMRFPDQVDPGHVTLPRVAVIAEFQSSETKRNQGESFSSLLVIWFQDTFGDPPDTVLAQIASLDWDELAWNWDF